MKCDFHSFCVDFLLKILQYKLVLFPDSPPDIWLSPESLLFQGNNPSSSNWGSFSKAISSGNSTSSLWGRLSLQIARMSSHLIRMSRPAASGPADNVCLGEEMPAC